MTDIDDDIWFEQRRRALQNRATLGYYSHHMTSVPDRGGGVGSRTLPGAGRVKPRRMWWCGPCRRYISQLDHVCAPHVDRAS